MRMNMNEPVTFDDMKDLILNMYCGTAIKRESDPKFKDCHLILFDKDDYKKFVEMANRLSRK